jgi:prepilin-type N-terminal cleavage/methylation domain-containing protein
MAMTRLSRENGFTLTELVITTMVMLVIAGIITQTALQATRTYSHQQSYIDARKNAGASLDMLVRLIRMAQVIDPDPDGNGVMDSIRVQSDWNPSNGVTTDPYENVTFTVVNGQLLKQEASDATPVAFADRVSSVVFAYYDTNNVLLTTPATSASKIAYVTITMTTTPPKAGLNAIVMSSAAAVRRTE